MLALMQYLFALLASSLPAGQLSPTPPSQDPWYTAPNGFETASPGDIFRARSAPGNLTTIFSDSSAAYNVLYRTTDSRYQPSWAVSTLFVPKENDGHALLSYQIPYNSDDVDSSPSYSLYAPLTPLSKLVYTDIQTALGLGWYVNVPDFEGPLASFSLGVQAGHAVIDSVRAALHPRFGLANDARYALWGYSGGSIASEWAAELQVQYAPELDFAGAALGGLVSNVTSVYPAVSGTPFAALIPLSLIGLTSQYPEARDYLISQLKPNGPFNKTAFFRAEKLSVEEAFAVYADQDIYQYFKTGKRFFDAPVLQSVIDQEGQMGFHGVPQMPLLIYKAIADEITPIHDTDFLVETYCSVGADVLYERNTIGGHIAEETNGDARALQWLGQVLSDSYEHEGCTVKDVSLNITDSPV